MVGCSDNDRLINLVDFLPQHLYDSETFDFTKLFENFLNTMYEDRDHPCNYGILKKIEQIGDLHDPQLMDSEYLQFYANFLGYDLTLNRSEIGNITNEVAADGTYIDDEESKKYLRFVVENLPNWYKIKSTRNAVKIMLFSFGIVGDLFTLFSDDYDKNWVSDREDDVLSIATQIPSSYYPTPHFQLAVNLRETSPIWLQNLGTILNAIDSITPINTVFERFGGYYDMDPAIINVFAGSPHITQSIYIDWPNSPATLTPSSTYTVITIAGTGASGNTNGAGNVATFAEPRGVVVDASGNVYVADEGKNKIRIITQAGEVSTFAGSTGCAGEAD